MRSSFKCLGIIGLIALMVAASGCAAGGKPSDTATAAGNVAADRIFQSLNSGNYTDFSTNLSYQMNQGVNESWFNDFRSGIRDKYGNYTSRSEPQATNVGAYNNFVYDTKFEKGSITFTISMDATDPYKVSGIHLK
jgi:hypothetical protein